MEYLPIIYHKNQLNVGRYTSPMDPMGYGNLSKQNNDQSRENWKLHVTSHKKIIREVSQGNLSAGNSGRIFTVPGKPSVPFF